MGNLINKLLPRRAERILRRQGRVIKRHRNKIIVMSLIKPLFFFLLEADSPKNYVQIKNYNEAITEFHGKTDSTNQYIYPNTTNIKRYENFHYKWKKD
jgi:hypothetical protein